MNSTQNAWKNAQDEDLNPIYYDEDLHQIGILAMTIDQDENSRNQLNQYSVNKAFFTLGNTTFQIKKNPLFQHYAVVYDTGKANVGTEFFNRDAYGIQTKISNIEIELKSRNIILSSLYVYSDINSTPILYYFKKEEQRWTNTQVQFNPEIKGKITSCPNVNTPSSPVYKLNEATLNFITDTEHKKSILLLHPTVSEINLKCVKDVFTNADKHRKEIIIEGQTRNETYSAFVTPSVCHPDNQQNTEYWHANYGYIKQLIHSKEKGKSSNNKYNNIVNIATAACMMGYPLQCKTGIDPKKTDSSKQLVKHDLAFYGKEVIQKVENILPKNNPYETATLLNFKRLLSYIPFICKNNTNKEIRIHFHLPYIDYMISYVKLFLRGRITITALNQAFKLTEANKKEYIIKLQAILDGCHLDQSIKSRIKLEVLSPFEQLKKFLGTNGSDATGFLRKFDIDPSIQPEPVELKSSRESAAPSQTHASTLKANDTTMTVSVTLNNNLENPAQNNAAFMLHQAIQKLQNELFNTLTNPSSTPNKQKSSPIEFLPKKDLPDAETIRLKEKEFIKKCFEFLTEETPDNRLCNTWKKMKIEWDGQESSEQEEKKSPIEQFLCLGNAVIPCYTALLGESSALILDSSEDPIRRQVERIFKNDKNDRNLSLTAFLLLDLVLVYEEALLITKTPRPLAIKNNASTSTQAKAVEETKEKNYNGSLFYARTVSEMVELLDGKKNQNSPLTPRRANSVKPTSLLTYSLYQKSANNLAGYLLGHDKMMLSEPSSLPGKNT